MSNTQTGAGESVRLQVVVDPFTGRISGDSDRLQQVFLNPQQRHQVHSQGRKSRCCFDRVNSHVEVRVIDTGEGISPDFLPHVFERFQQG